MATAFQMIPTEQGADNGQNPANRMPFNIEAEKALLGALLLENRLLEDITLQLREEHFYEPLHGRIFAQIKRLADLNMVSNPITLKPLFEQDPAMQEVGGALYLLQLTEDPSVVIAARDCAQQIYDLALLRALVMVGADLVQGATDTSREVAPMKQIEAAEEALYRVAESGEVAGGTVDFAGASKKAVEMAAKAMKTGGKLSGLTTGLNGLNRKIGGLHNSDLLILAGRPAMGKTALATNIAFSTAFRYKMDQRDGISPTTGAPVAFFSLEMSADQLATRVLAEQARISSESLRMGRLNQAEFNELARASANLHDLPLYIDDTPGLSIATMRARARRLKRQKGIGLVIVDYLQLLTGSSKSGDNRVQEISEITRGLKTLAKELDIPVIALSQLSRQVENREDKRPQLSDLRESGSIEQDADIVMFVYRGEYYHLGKKPEEDSPGFAAWQAEADRLFGRAEVIVAKQRHGATGTVDLVFEREYTKFADPADDMGYSDQGY